MSVKISRVLHAGYVFECEQTQIIFDPIFENPFSRNCYAYPNVNFDIEQIKQLKFSAIFISHFHDDHCSFESLNYLDRSTPVYVYCVFDKLFSLLNELGFKNVYSLKIDVSIKIGKFEIIPRRALDSEVDSIFQIKVEDLNILNVVDSWIDLEVAEQLVTESPWDLVLWPFQTMREVEVLAPSRTVVDSTQRPEFPAEWLEQIKKLNPKYIVPSSCQFIQESWSWYNHAMFPITYRQFNDEILSILPATRVVRMNPSVSVVIDKESLKISAPLSWIKPIGEQDVDYVYRPSLKPMLTSEIAKHFEPLTVEQTEFIFSYCRKGLLEKYKELDLSNEEYFKKSRIWKLSIFDHNGELTCFYYKLTKNNIELIADSEALLSWSTEIPISKFYAALQLGESLTSMYIRVNEKKFNSDVEKEIQDVDVIEDPLIRCLFNDVFGSYQKVQLKRINHEKTNAIKSNDEIKFI